MESSQEVSQQSRLERVVGSRPMIAACFGAAAIALSTAMVNTEVPYEFTWNGIMQNLAFIGGAALGLIGISIRKENL